MTRPNGYDIIGWERYCDFTSDTGEFEGISYDYLIDREDPEDPGLEYFYTQTYNRYLLEDDSVVICKCVITPSYDTSLVNYIRTFLHPDGREFSWVQPIAIAPLTSGDAIGTPLILEDVDKSRRAFYDYRDRERLSALGYTAYRYRKLMEGTTYEMLLKIKAGD